MTEDEFRTEARRILIAFDFYFDSDIKVKKRRERGPHPYDRLIYEFRWVTEHIDIDFGTFEKLNSWSFELCKSGNNLECDSWPIEPTIHMQGDHSRFAMRMARGMFRLGFDISLIETELNLTITAHEKLEWQLEFARRMREDARENGA